MRNLFLFLRSSLLLLRNYINLFLEVFTRLEYWNLGCRNLDFFLGSWVSSNSFFSFSYFKGTKSNELNFFTLLKSTYHCVKKSLQECLRVFLGKTGSFSQCSD